MLNRAWEEWRVVKSNRINLTKFRLPRKRKKSMWLNRVQPISTPKFIITEARNYRPLPSTWMKGGSKAQLSPLPDFRSLWQGQYLITRIYSLLWRPSGFVPQVPIFDDNNNVVLYSIVWFPRWSLSVRIYFWLCDPDITFVPQEGHVGVDTTSKLGTWAIRISQLMVTLTHLYFWGLSACSATMLLYQRHREALHNAVASYRHQTCGRYIEVRIRSSVVSDFPTLY